MRRGAFEEADLLLNQGVNAWDEVTRAVVPTLSQAQAMAWIMNNNLGTGMYLTNARLLGKPGEKVYEVMWNSRALANRLLTNRALKADASETATRVQDKLIEARARLSQLITFQAKPDKVATLREAITATRLNLDTDSPASNSGDRDALPPKFWAAFSLSGDWR